MSLLETIMRIVIRAETREAIAGLKDFDSQVSKTADNASAASSEISQTTNSLSSVSGAANVAKSALAGVGTGLAIGAAIAVVGALTAALVEFITTSKKAEDGAKAFELALAQISQRVSDIKDQLDFEKKFTDLFDKLKGNKDSQTLNDDLANNAKKVKELQKAYQDLTKARQDNLANGNAKNFDEDQRNSFIELKKIEEEINKAKQEGVLISLQQQIATKKEVEDTKGVKDELQKRIAILNETKRILDSLNGKDQPVFKQAAAASPNSLDVQILNAQIQKAAKDAANDPANKDAFEQLGDALKAKLEAVLNPNLKLKINLDDSQDIDIDKERAKIEKAIDKIANKTIKLPSPKVDTKDFDNTVAKIRETLINGIESIAGAIGESFSGGGISTFIKGFANTIGEGLKTVGKILIESAIKLEAVKKAAEALGKASPALAIVAGVAAIAAGTLIESLANKQIGATKFATGGIVTQAQLGIVGEAGPEAIIPISQLGRFVKGIQKNASGQLSGEVRLRGQDLMIALARANKNQSLVS